MKKIPTIEEIAEAVCKGKATPEHVMFILSEHVKSRVNLAAVRDQFAGQVIAATLSHVKNMVCLGGGDAEQIKGMAEDAYIMADAMMKVRGL